MTQETPATGSAAPIDWKKIGSPRCDTGAQTEALRAMGLDANARPINGVAPDFSQIVQQIPQLISRDMNGQPVWNPALDIATISKTNGGKQISAAGADGNVHMIELEAAIIAAAQVALQQGISLKDVPLQDIIDGACAPLKKIMGNAPAVCNTGPPAR